MKKTQFVCLVLGMFPACGATGDDLEGELPGDEISDEEDFEGDEPDEGGMGKADAVGTVRDNESACSTRVVLGLSRQIIDEMNCLSPNALVRVEGPGIIDNGTALFPYFTSAAAADLHAAARETPISLVSGYRTVAQQYLLRLWDLRGRCGVRIAARPGRSNHESGRSIDIRDAGSMVSLMRRHNWQRTVRGDSVHFDHMTSPDLRGLDVHAFQRLWNLNNAGDQIDEDGEYGPQTEARLRQSPAAGFAIGASCQ